VTTPCDDMEFVDSIRKMLRNIDGVAALSDQFKLALQFVPEQIQSGNVDVHIQAIFNNKLEYLLEESAQYLTLAIAMYIFNRPLKFSHNGTNDLFNYIEKNLIGRLPNGELAIQFIKIEFTDMKSSFKYFRENPKYYNPSRPAQPTSNKLANTAQLSENANNNRRFSFYIFERCYKKKY